MSSISRSLLLPITLVLFAAGAVAGTAFLARGGVMTIVLREDGFHPGELHARSGDRIRFVNLTSETVRPASDPHPTHEYYSELDARSGIAPGSSWIFRLDRPGIWHFHDHTNEGRTGTMYIKDIQGVLPSSVGCEGSEAQTDRCFDELVRTTTRTKGIQAAFDLLGERYDEGALPRACHWTGHKIGEEAYRQELAGKPFAFDPAMYHCGYGFLHGYLEALLRGNPAEKEQKEKVIGFCKKAAAELKGEAWDNCVHGVGSGFTANPPDPEHWGDASGMIREGLSTCERYFENRDRETCFTGVYATIANFASARSYGLSLSEDILAFCRREPAFNQRACIGEFIAKARTVYGNDLAKLEKAAEGLDAAQAFRVVRVGANVILQDDILDRTLQAKYRDACLALPSPLDAACLQGMVWGFIYHGRMGAEYEPVIEFCAAPSLPPADQERCFSDIVTFASRTYSEEKMAAVCQAIVRTGRPCPPGSPTID